MIIGENIDLLKKIIEWAKTNSHKIKCPDQDAINYVCRDSNIILPMKFGFMDCFVKNPLFKERGYGKEIVECLNNPVIVHYNGTSPWYKEYKKHTMHEEWMKYNNMMEKPVKRHYQAKGILLLK